MFRVKICGITRAEDAQAVESAGGDAIGLNFYRQSPRYVEPARALDITGPIGPQVQRVGVFVNSPAHEIDSVVQTAGIDWVQLHGDEPADFLCELGPTPIVRAVRVNDEKLNECLDYVARSMGCGRSPDALLVDVFESESYGGTGKRVSVNLLERIRREFPGIPLILAGGLNAQNVADAIRQIGPDGVDTASGVESSPGVKNSSQLAVFIMAAQQAFGSRT